MECRKVLQVHSKIRCIITGFFSLFFNLIFNRITTFTFNLNVKIMKKIFMLLTLFFCHQWAQSQTIAGYAVNGYLQNAVHPNSCSSEFVTGVPDDSLWVNFDTGNIMNGTFNHVSTDSIGDELLIETGFHPSNYNVSLLLSTGLYSATHVVGTNDWLDIDSVFWYYAFTACNEGSGLSPRHILPLDYSQDFGLTTADTVTGIKIEFLFTTGTPDLAGVYLVTAQPVAAKSLQIDEQLSIFPNPITNQVTFTSNLAKETVVEIYDINANSITKRKFIHTTTIDTDNLNSGIYFYKVYSNNEIIEKGKLIK
jgi:hypothetical protein